MKHISSRLRFWSHVDKFGVQIITDSRCWNWTGPRRDGGYGRFRVNGVKTEAHRYSYEIHKGSIPNNQLICHRCDNPSCVNPEHLFVGSVIDNVRDMVNKGRQAKGESKPTSKLSECDVLYIRKIYRSKHRINGLKALALRYHVSVRTMWSIIHKETWSHI